MSNHIYIHTGDTQVGQLVHHAIRPQLSVLNKHFCKCLMINTSIYCYMFEACDMMGTELYLHEIEVCTSYDAREELQEGTVCVCVCVANNIACLCMVLFQHRMFTAVHKHYSVDAWKEFAAKNKEAIKVRHI